MEDRLGRAPLGVGSKDRPASTDPLLVCLGAQLTASSVAGLVDGQMTTEGTIGSAILMFESTARLLDRLE